MGVFACSRRISLSTSALARADRAEIHGRLGALPLGVGDRDRILVDVETDEKRCRL